MSIRTRDNEYSYYPSGWLETFAAGTEWAYRRGAARTLEGYVTIYEQVNAKGEQYIVFEAVIDYGRYRVHQEWRPRSRRMTERGLLIAARRWLREVGG